MQSSKLTLPDVLHDDTKDLRNVYDLSMDQNGTVNDTITQITDSQYYIETELAKLFTDRKISDNSHVKIISLNVANVLYKLSSLKRLLSNISNESNKPNIICVSETHLSESKCQGYMSEEITNLLPGYKFFHYDRQTKKGGGVGIFVQDNLVE